MKINLDHVCFFHLLQDTEVVRGADLIKIDGIVLGLLGHKHDLEVYICETCYDWLNDKGLIKT